MLPGKIIDDVLTLNRHNGLTEITWDGTHCALDKLQKYSINLLDAASYLRILPLVNTVAITEKAIRCLVNYEN